MRVLHRVIRILIVIWLLLLAGFFLFRCQYRDTVTLLAETQIRNITSDIINAAVDRQIEEGNIRYDRIVYFEKDLNGRITALKTNMSEINHLKTDILNLINREILAVDTDLLGIPLGSLFFPELLAGKGPELPVQILSVRNSDADFTSEFTEAGINQTLQRINMNVNVDVAVLVLGRHNHFTVESQVVVAETVIVGQVPETLLQTGGLYGTKREN